MNKKKKFFYVLALSLLFHTSYFILHTSNGVFAQEISLSISPPLLEVTIKPGSSFTQPYEITNNSQNDIYLKTIVSPFEPADEEGNIKIVGNEQGAMSSQEGENFFSLANSNLKLNQTFKLSVGEVKRLLLKIDTPPNSSEKDYYFTFLAEQSSEGLFIEKGSGGENLIKIGANILLTVSESMKPKKELILAKFTAIPKIADVFDKVYFEVLAQNIGESFSKPMGNLEIYYFGRQKVKVLELRPDNVLASFSRKIKCIGEEIRDMRYEIRNQGDCFFSSFVPGYYKAVVSVSADGEGEMQTAAVSFWLMPIKLIIILIVLTIIVVGIRRKIKKSL